MKLVIEWSEEVSYSSTIEVDEAEVRQWLTMDHKGVYHPDQNDPETPLTAKEIKEFLESGDEEVWFEQCNSSLDFCFVDDRKLDNARLEGDAE